MKLHAFSTAVIVTANAMGTTQADVSYCCCGRSRTAKELRESISGAQLDAGDLEQQQQHLKRQLATLSDRIKRLESQVRFVVRGAGCTQKRARDNKTSTSPIVMKKWSSTAAAYSVIAAPCSMFCALTVLLLSSLAALPGI
jgi:hypothetical protein